MDLPTLASLCCEGGESVIVRGGGVGRCSLDGGGNTSLYEDIPRFRNVVIGDGTRSFGLRGWKGALGAIARASLSPGHCSLVGMRDSWGFDTLGGDRCEMK